jgi:hypothetical protein
VTHAQGYRRSYAPPPPAQPAARPVAAARRGRRGSIDQRVAERERNPEVSGYTRANEESEALWEQAADLLDEALGTTATTVAGAWARVALAAATLRTDHTIGGELTSDMDIGGVLGAIDDLERLGAMPGKAVRS